MNREMKEGWDSFWGFRLKSRPKNIRPRQRRVLRVLGRYVCSGIVVCDAGCGSGFFSHYFISKGCSAYCIDYSEKAMQLTYEATGGQAERYLRRNLLDDTLGLELKNTFDLIFTDGLFEHFPKIEQAKIMSNLVAMKKSDGIMVTFVPNILSHWEPIRRAMRYTPGGLQVWEKAFTIGGLTRLVRQSGQEIIEKGGINVLPIAHSPLEIFSRWIGSSIYVVSR